MDSNACCASRRQPLNKGLGIEVDDALEMIEHTEV